MTAERRPRRPVHLAASGGGHLELLSAVEDAFEDCTQVWVVSPGSRAKALAASGAIVHEVPNPGRAISKVLPNIWACLRTALRERPSVVVTSGAGSVVAFTVFARLLGAKVVFIETMARIDDASMSGRVLSRIASSVLVQWPEMSAVYRGSRVCRPALCEAVAPRQDRGAGTFVGVGTHSEPFNRLLALVDRAVDEGTLPGPVIAQTGVSTYVPRNFEATSWLSPYEMEDAISHARFIVSHAGSGVISSALRAGRKPLVLPRLERYGEHFDDHQTQLASRLGELGLVLPIQDGITPELVAEADEGLDDEPQLSEAPAVRDALMDELDRLRAIEPEPAIAA